MMSSGAVEELYVCMYVVFNARGAVLSTSRRVWGAPRLGTKYKSEKPSGSRPRPPPHLARNAFPALGSAMCGREALAKLRPPASMRRCAQRGRKLPKG